MEKSKNNDTIQLKKKDFIWNALEDGWEIKKNKDSYIFTKEHEGEKKVFSEDYLRRFIIKNFKGDSLLS
jgi:hypothetical protein